MQPKFDDEDVLIPLLQQAPYSALRLPDGRVLAWAEYGSPQGLPLLLVPDIGSSRLAPEWLLHDTALPIGIRLLAVDRPGIGASDPIGFGGIEELAEDLRRMVETLAVGRVALIGIGRGADDALALATHHPRLVSSVSAVSMRLPRPQTRRRTRWRQPRPPRTPTAASSGPLACWLHSAGRTADLTLEPTWRRMLDRLDPTAAQVLADRWMEPDFRKAVAADAAQINSTWTMPAAPGETYTRPPDSGALTVPVDLWHARHETGTTLADIQAHAATRAGWSVHPTVGSSAVLGAWPDILQLAGARFLRRP